MGTITRRLTRKIGLFLVLVLYIFSSIFSFIPV